MGDGKNGVCMRIENASPRGAFARSASAKRIRCFSTAFVIATAASIGGSHGALGPTAGDLPPEVSRAQPGLVGTSLDNDSLTIAIAFPEEDYFVASPLLEDAVRALTSSLAYTPPTAEAVAEEVSLGAALAIERFTQTARRIRHNARADLRHIHEAIRELEAQAGSPDDILEFEEMKVARWIVDAVRQASMLTGVDAVYMMALADKESSLIPDISARTSSAEGLFQFIEQTWLEVVEKFGATYGLEAEAEAIAVDRKTGRRSVADAKERERILNLRGDPLIAGIMAGEMMKRDRARIEAELERELTWHEMYMAHFLGAGGAIRLLKLAQESPKKSASKEFPAAARANRTLFFAGKGKGSALSVEQVYERIETMIAPRLERYASLEGAPPPTQIARARLGPLPVRLRSGG
jgi:hypothetical protein